MSENRMYPDSHSRREENLMKMNMARALSLLILGSIGTMLVVNQQSAALSPSFTAIDMAQAAPSGEEFVPIRPAIDRYLSMDTPRSAIARPEVCEPRVPAYVGWDGECYRFNPFVTPGVGLHFLWGAQVWSGPTVTVQRWNTEECDWDALGQILEGTADHSGSEPLGQVEDDDIIRLQWETDDPLLREQIYRLMPDEKDMPVLTRPQGEDWRLPDGTFVLGRTKLLSSDPAVWDVRSPDWRSIDYGAGYPTGVSAMLSRNTVTIYAYTYRGQTDRIITLDTYNVEHDRWDLLAELDPEAYRGTPSSNGVYSIPWGYYPLKSGSLVRLRVLCKATGKSMFPLDIAIPLA